MAASAFGKGGKAPQRAFFHWELHESGKPIQAARFGNWKAVGNGTDQPIEIYDLDTDAAESTDLAKSRPDLVEKAEKNLRRIPSPRSQLAA